MLNILELHRQLLEAALQPFAAALFRWRERLGLEGKKPAEAAEEGEVR